MITVNMHDAKSSLSKLVEAVENGSEDEIVIARNGKPAAKLVPITAKLAGGIILGILDGKYPPMTLEGFNATDAEIAAMFEASEIEPAR